MSGIRIGKVTRFFDHISVAVLALTDKLRVGDTLHFLGRATDFKQKINSMQIEHQNVNEAGPGEDVAVKVEQRAHLNDAVFKITEEE